jgi:hypothetical protein
VRYYGSHVCRLLVYKLQYDRSGVSQHRQLEGANMPAGESAFLLEMWARVLTSVHQFYSS